MNDAVPRELAERPPRLPPAALFLRSRGSVSGRPVAVPISITNTIAARTTNNPRHDVIRSSCPPRIGASVGARPVTSSSSEKTRAAAAPDRRSRTTARAITIPAAPAKPWTRRSATSTEIEGATAHASDAAQ